MADYYYGIDIGGTSIKLGLFSEGVLIKHWQLPTDISQKGENILPDIVRSLPSPAIGAGLAVPGAVLEDGTINRCVNLGWDVCKPGEIFEHLSGIPCKVLNDANAATLGEFWAGAAKGNKDVLCVTLGTGVGGGLILDGKLRFGFFGTAGELGHLCLDPDGPVCSCGNHGCLETYCSATGVCRLGREVGLVNLSCQEIFNLAKQGNQQALLTVDKACSSLARGIAAACAIVDPQVIVIAGGMAKAGNFLLEKIISSYKRYAFHACRNVKFTLASLGQDAGIFGAAYFSLTKKI